MITDNDNIYLNQDNSKAIPTLHKVVESIIPASPRITLDEKEHSLDLILDKYKGLPRFERFSVSEEEQFHIKYQAISNNAKDTFSEHSRFKDMIKKSSVLSYFVEEIKNKAPAFGDYYALMYLNRKADFSEARKAVEFFSYTFKDKITR